MADEKIIFSMVGVSKTFTNQKRVLNNIYLSFFYGAKIGIIGLNGSGKSTLMKIIAGIDKNFEGEVVFSPGYTVGYLEQEPKLDDEKTVREVVEEGCAATVALLKEYEEINTKLCEPMSDDEMARLIERQGELYEKIDHCNGWELDSVLERAMDALRCPDPDQPVKHLSGGERRRVALCRLLLQQPDVLLLDEPTNHMDMRSKDILKNAIMKYDGTVVVVSHDREFLDGMVEKVYEFRDGGVKEYLGGIYYFLEKRKIESLREIERRDPSPKGAAAKGAAGNDSGAGSAAGRGAAGTKAAAKSGPVKSSAAEEPAKAVSAGKASYEQRKEQEKLLRKLRRNVETIEAELADIEKRIAEYDARFAAATAYDEADYKAYNELKTRYDRQMHEWEKASYELEITEGE